MNLNYGVLVLALVSWQSLARNFYVAPKGQDTHTGTPYVSKTLVPKNGSYTILYNCLSAL
jgi:hypothetical protein